MNHAGAWRETADRCQFLLGLEDAASLPLRSIADERHGGERATERRIVAQELQRIDELTECFGHDPVGEFVRGFFAFEPVEFTTQLDRFDSVFDFGQSIGGQQDGPAVEVQMSGGLLWGERDACQISGSRLCRK